MAGGDGNSQILQQQGETRLRTCGSAFDVELSACCCAFAVIHRDAVCTRAYSLYQILNMPDKRVRLEKGVHMEIFSVEDGIWASIQIKSYQVPA